MPGGIDKINKELQEKKVNPTKIPNELEFIKLLNQGIKKSKNGKEKEDKKFWISQLGNPCDRYLYLHYHGLLTAEQINPDKQRVFDHGHATEERYAQYFRRLGILKYKEHRIEIEDPPISGRADFVLFIKEPETHYKIIELKTINDKAFSALERPKPDHEVQLLAYLHLLNYDYGSVLYENKDNQRVKCFPIEKDIEMWENILDRCRRIQSMIEAPEIDEKNHSIYCRCD